MADSEERVPLLDKKTHGDGEIVVEEIKNKGDGVVEKEEEKQSHGGEEKEEEKEKNHGHGEKEEENHGHGEKEEEEEEEEEEGTLGEEKEEENGTLGEEEEISESPETNQQDSLGNTVTSDQPRQDSLGNTVVAEQQRQVRYVTQSGKDSFKSLKRKYKKITRDEMNSNLSSRDTVSFFLSNINGYEVLTGTALVAGGLLASGASMSNYILRLVLVISFLYGIVSATLLTYKILRNMELGTMSLIKMRKKKFVTRASRVSSELVGVLEGAEDASDLREDEAKEQIADMINFHYRSSSHTDFVNYLGNICVHVMFFFIWIIGYILHHDPNNGAFLIFHGDISPSTRRPPS